MDFYSYKSINKPYKFLNRKQGLNSGWFWYAIYTFHTFCISIVFRRKSEQTVWISQCKQQRRTFYPLIRVDTCSILYIVSWKIYNSSLISIWQGAYSRHDLSASGLHLKSEDKNAGITYRIIIKGAVLKWVKHSEHLNMFYINVKDYDF